MKYQIEKNENVQIIRIKEERLDSNLAPELKTIFLVLTKHENAKILIDLEQVSYVDSSGLGALLFGFRQARDRLRRPGYIPHLWWIYSSSPVHLPRTGV